MSNKDLALEIANKTLATLGAILSILTSIIFIYAVATGAELTAGPIVAGVMGIIGLTLVVSYIVSVITDKVRYA